jgi:hypothetical protein
MSTMTMSPIPSFHQDLEPPRSQPAPASESARLTSLSLPVETELWQLSEHWKKLARRLERQAVCVTSKCWLSHKGTLECSASTAGE